MPVPMPYSKNNISEPQTASHDFECDYCDAPIYAGGVFHFWQTHNRVCPNCAEELGNE